MHGERSMNEKRERTDLDLIAQILLLAVEVFCVATPAQLAGLETANVLLIQPRLLLLLSQVLDRIKG